MDSFALSLFIAILTFGLCCSLSPVKNNELQYCSFFDNRAPEAEPNLKNCTWFKDNSCCRQAEISATFGRVKPLRGASPSCQRYTNYLMCYICSPYQYLFYFRESLTVCEEFCDAWYDACKTAISKGSVIQELFVDGESYCKSQRFNVDKHINGRCFNFDAKLDTSGSPSYNIWHQNSHILMGIYLYILITWSKNVISI
ncbi:hypothetical protein SNE40_020276 [Patella caerulea]|uniref:Folate receptor-like domain-containing protein n=1 Tax=Patella caerulea TaxID=87958 RepID=A0AAN8G3V3_PATCE